MIVGGIAQLVTGHVGMASLSGPIGIGEIAADAYQESWTRFVWLMAVISVNLAILNLLPIPILDGGQIVLAAAEGIKGSPLPARARDIAQTVGLSLILLLMGVAFWNDIARHWSGVVSFLTDLGSGRRAARARDLRGARRGGALRGRRAARRGGRRRQRAPRRDPARVPRPAARAGGTARGRDRRDRARDRAGLVHRACASASRPRSVSRSAPSASSCRCPRWRRSRCRPRARSSWRRSLDARRGEVYAGLYDAEAARAPARPLLRARGLARDLAAARTRRSRSWAAALPPTAAELEAALGARARFLPEAAGVLRARTVGRLGLRLPRTACPARRKRSSCAICAARRPRRSAWLYTRIRTHTLEPTPIRPRNR